MQKLKISLIISCVFLIASTTAFLLEAQESQSSKETGAAVGASSVNLNGKDLKPVPINEGLITPEKEKYAFLVAAYDYDTGLASLAYPGADVDAIKKRLVEIGFSEENIVVLRSGSTFGVAPTKEHIEKRYADLLSHVKEGDLVFVYLSGHGLQLKGSDVSYFAPVDVNLDDVSNTSVSINEMMRQLSVSSAEFRWMIVDACRNDPNNEKSVFTVRTTNAKGLASINKIPPAISLLQSCQPGAYSYEGGASVQNGVFTLALLEALSEEGKGDLNGDGAVSFLEICQYVTTRTNALANKYHNARQVPNLSGNFTDFAFLEGLEKGEAAKLYQEVCDLLSRKYYFSALEKIRLACQKDPENQVYADMQKTLEALVEGENAKTIQAHIAQGWKYYAEKDYSNALKEANSALKLDPTNAAALALKKQSENPPKDDPKSNPLPNDYLASNGTEYRLIKAGSFMMGSPLSGEEVVKKYPTSFDAKYFNAPQHKVTLTQDFYLAKYPITRGEFKRFVDATGYKTTAEKEGSAWRMTKEGKWEDVDGASWKDPGFEQTDRHPVVCVSYDDALAYVAWLNKSSKPEEELNGLKPTYRLPTEAEWEYACRAGTRTEFFWGDDEKDGKGYLNGAGKEKAPFGRVWTNSFSFDDGYSATSPVGSFKPNLWGLYDMLGEVLEWTSDWYGDYPNGNVTDPKGSASGSYRVLRGGGWSYAPAGCRCAFRGNDAPGRRYAYIGMRVAFSLTSK